MSVGEYEGYVRALNHLEAEGGGIRKGWSEAQKTRLRNTYESLLTRWPWLEGFWVRWAESEFKLGSADAATAVYRRALHKQHVPYSVTVWVSFLSFLTHVCHTGPVVPQFVRDLFNEASEAIGSHFLSHEFWDLYLEWAPSPVSILLHILDDLTIHQYARFYARLIDLLHAPTTSLLEFQSVMLNEPTDAASSDEEQQLREVVYSRLKLKYELQSRRVSAAFAFESKIKRPFFHPRPLPQQELETWIAYIDSTSDPVPLYRRALIAAALDAGLWLKYLRYLVSQQATKEMIVLAMEGAAGTGMVSLNLYYALWLELEGSFERANEVYLKLTRQKDATPDAIVQYSQYLHRRGEQVQAKTELINGFKRVPSVALISELSNYVESVDRELDWPEDTEDVELWRARLAAYPAQADEIFESAPENSITSEYLTLLSRTDAAKFLEVDRMVHRSALNV